MESSDYTVPALIIEDDRSAAEFFGRLLQSAGFDVTVTNSGADGIMAARRHQFAAILLDIRLPDLDGLEVLRMLSAERNNARVVVVSGHLNVQLTIEAIKLGASSILEKPVDSEQLIAAVATPMFPTAKSGADRATANRHLAAPSEADNHHSVVHRWATDVLKGCTANDDAKTVAAWAKRIGTSSTMICQRCSMLGIKPHDARDLMRALFAMLESEGQRCAPHVLLDIADGRTLHAFQRKAGPGFQASRDIDSVNRFLDSQSFVEPHHYGVTVLRSLLAKLLSREKP